MSIAVPSGSLHTTVEAMLLALFILATSIWIGGYIAIAVVARTAAATLDPSARVRFFRSLGRSYLWVGIPALLVALGTGAVLLRDRDRDTLLVATVLIAAIMVACLAIAIAQARRMTRLRRRALDAPDDERLAQLIRRDGRAAALLRAVLGLLSLALVVFGSFLAT